jgi:hypothetical protein
MEETSDKLSSAFQFVGLKFMYEWLTRLGKFCTNQIHVANRLSFQKGVTC